MFGSLIEQISYGSSPPKEHVQVVSYAFLEQWSKVMVKQAPNLLPPNSICFKNASLLVLNINLLSW